MSNFKDTIYSILTEDATDRAAAGVKAQVDKERERQAAFPTPEQRAAQSQPTTQTPEEEAKSRENNAKVLGDITRKNEAQKAREATSEGRREIDDEQRTKMGLDPRTDEDFEAIDAKRQSEEDKRQERMDFRNSPAGKAAIFQEKQARIDARMAREENNAGTFVRGSNGVQKFVPTLTDVEKTKNRLRQIRDNNAASETFRTTRDDWIDSDEGIDANENRATERENRAGTDAAIAAADAATTKRKKRVEAEAAAKANRPEAYSHNKALTFFAEQLKRKYIEEEVVNPENQPMTKSEISHRDKIKHKDPAKNARVVKGPRGRLDTSEEAKYRLATYITMRGRKGKKKENK